MIKETKLEKIFHATPAFDKRHSDPKKNYGIGPVKMFMILKGKNAAVSFVFATPMYLQKTHEENIKKHMRDFEMLDILTRGMGYDVGLHTTEPQFEGQPPGKPCEWLDGRDCYCDGSALAADEYYKVLIEQGSDKIWEMLEERYKKELYK